MTDLRCAVSAYLTVRRQLGFALKEAGQDLERFVEFMDRAGAERVTSELALDVGQVGIGASASVASAARGGARLRSLPQHDRPSDRGSVGGSAQGQPPARRPIPLTPTRRSRR